MNKDEKNVMSDWIEEIFDDYSAICNGRKLLGYVNNAPVYAKYSGNIIKWKVIEDIQLEIDCTIIELKKRLKEREDPERLFSVFKVDGSTLIQSFYWPNED